MALHEPRENRKNSAQSTRTVSRVLYVNVQFVICRANQIRHNAVLI